jgi:hypothetical protein
MIESYVYTKDATLRATAGSRGRIYWGFDSSGILVVTSLPYASCILYPASCILHPASCILYPVSCIQCPAYSPSKRQHIANTGSNRQETRLEHIVLTDTIRGTVNATTLIPPPEYIQQHSRQQHSSSSTVGSSTVAAAQ